MTGAIDTRAASDAPDARHTAPSARGRTDGETMRAQLVGDGCLRPAGSTSETPSHRSSRGVAITVDDDVFRRVAADVVRHHAEQLAVIRKSCDRRLLPFLDRALDLAARQRASQGELSADSDDLRAFANRKR